MQEKILIFLILYHILISLLFISSILITLYMKPLTLTDGNSIINGILRI